MYTYDILCSIKFYSSINGGRNELPPIKAKEYTYRPVFRLDGDSEGYCCGVIIGNYLSEYDFDIEIENIKIMFINYELIRKKINIGKTFKLMEGNKVIASGVIKKMCS